MRSSWVYVGATEAAVLGDVSNNWIEKRIASGELVAVHLDDRKVGGRPRNLYRLDKVLELVQHKRR